jgi:type III secretion protein Q
MTPQVSTWQKQAPISAKATTVTGLVDRLPSLTASAARAARIGFDRRFPSWLATNFGPQVATSRPYGATIERLVLDLSCAHGTLTLSTDAAPWPALRLAAQHPDPRTALAVATVLLQTALATGASLLPELSLSAIRLEAPGTTPTAPSPALMIDGMPVGMVGMSPDLAATIAALLRDAASGYAAELSGLRLPARLRLFSRGLRWSRLCALGQGDIVLSGLHRQAQGRWPVSLVFGTETTMQTKASAEIGAAGTRLHIEGQTQRIDESPLAAGTANGLPTALDDLQVPVAFEIDSTLLSLSEISALGPGAVIELDVALANARVRLVSHGQTLGSGQLVAVGEQLGVRIERMGIRQPQKQGNPS